MDDGTYKLDELARRAGISARTVRYYVQRGLVPAPRFQGKDTAYGREHLARLRAIKRLQDAFFPLDAIASTLDGKSIEEIEEIADKVAAPQLSQIEPVAPSVPPKPFGELMRRITLAPGVEILIAEDAPASSRALVEKLLNEGAVRSRSDR